MYIIYRDREETNISHQFWLIENAVSKKDTVNLGALPIEYLTEYSFYKP